MGLSYKVHELGTFFALGSGMAVGVDLLKQEGPLGPALAHSQPWESCHQSRYLSSPTQVKQPPLPQQPL